MSGQQQPFVTPSTKGAIGREPSILRLQNQRHAATEQVSASLFLAGEHLYGYEY